MIKRLLRMQKELKQTKQQMILLLPITGNQRIATAMGLQTRKPMNHPPTSKVAKSTRFTYIFGC